MNKNIKKILQKQRDTLSEFITAYDTKIDGINNEELDSTRYNHLLLTLDDIQNLFEEIDYKIDEIDEDLFLPVVF